MGSKTSSYLEDGCRKHWQGSREVRRGMESRNKGWHQACSHCGHLAPNPTGTSGGWHGTHTSNLFQLRDRELGHLPICFPSIVAGGLIFGDTNSLALPTCGSGKIPWGTEIQISTIRSFQEHTKLESLEEYRWGTNSFSFTEVAGVNSRQRVRWIGARRLRGQGHMRGLWLWSRWRSELGKWEGRRSDRWGRERLGRNHQQNLATDLACAHVGGELPDIDSKQCSTTVTTFLNLW